MFQIVLSSKKSCFFPFSLTYSLEPLRCWSTKSAREMRNSSVPGWEREIDQNFTALKPDVSDCAKF